MTLTSPENFPTEVIEQPHRLDLGNGSKGIISGCNPEIEVFLETPIQNLIGKTSKFF